MKFLKTLLLILILVISIISLIFANGCLKEEPVSIDGIILTANLDANGNPTAQTDTFKEGTKEIYLVIKVKNMQKTDNISVKWTYLDKGLEIDNKSFMPENKFSGNKIFKIKISQGFPYGNYEVKVFMNGLQIKSIPFKVN
ncbi:MAG: hypothetical protein M1479_01905 [Actinobacteria bacterium]|nr:hypothetical protein [Cyanobacteriota bacterium]MCL5771017.1 hypothetical protein [Actinomycetota bacterium]